MKDFKNFLLYTALYITVFFVNAATIKYNLPDLVEHDTIGGIIVIIIIIVSVIIATNMADILRNIREQQKERNGRHNS